MKLSQTVSKLWSGHEWSTADGRTDIQKFGGYNIIPCQFLWRGLIRGDNHSYICLYLIYIISVLPHVGLCSILFYPITLEGHRGTTDHGLCYRVPYHWRILELRTNYGLVAFGLHILWAAWEVSAKKSCCLLGPLYHYQCGCSQDSLLSLVSPRYLVFEVSFSLSMNVIEVCVTFRLLVFL